MKKHLPPHSLAELDFLKSMYWNLSIPEKLQKDLVPQSIQGHIASGHGVFQGNPESNIFIENVYQKLKKNPDKGRLNREKEIIEVFDLVDNLVDRKTNKLLKSDGSPILGFEPFKDYEIKNLESGLKGAVIMGCVDDSFWRADTLNKYEKTLDGKDLNIGYGKEYLVDKKIMKKRNLTLEDLSYKAYSKTEIKEFRKDGLISRKPGKNIENIFIRKNLGLGCCDDLMISSIGLIHGKDAMIMAWALDALDTYTKFIMNPKEGGYDQTLAKRIQDKWSKKYEELLAKPSEIREIIYLGAKENTPKINLSSSHRRFIQTEKKQHCPTIENHINYVEYGIRPKNYKLGFTQVSSDKFYDTLEERFKLFGKEYLLPESK